MPLVSVTFKAASSDRPGERALFSLTKKGEVLRSNRVGQRFLTRMVRTKPQALETLILNFNDLLTKPTKKRSPY